MPPHPSAIADGFPSRGSQDSAQAKPSCLQNKPVDPRRLPGADFIVAPCSDPFKRQPASRYRTSSSGRAAQMPASRESERRERAWFITMLLFIHLKGLSKVYGKALDAVKEK